MVQRTPSKTGQRGFTLVELLAVMAIMGILAGVVSGAVVGLGSTGQATRLQGDRNTIAKSADRFFTEAFPQTYPVVSLDTNGDGEVDGLDDFDLPGGDLGVRLIDFDAIIPQNATLRFVPDFLKEVPDSAALVSWRVDQATGNVFFTEDGAALVRPSLARMDVKAANISQSLEGASVQSDHTFTLTMRKGEAPINIIEMTIPAGYVIGGQQLPENSVMGSLAIRFEANNPWDTGNELTISTVPVVLVSPNRAKAEINYDANTGGSSDNINVKNIAAGAGPDERVLIIRLVPPSGENNPGTLTLNFDRTTEGGAADFTDYEDPDVNEATEIFVLTFFDHAQTESGADLVPQINLITNPKSKGVFRWLANQNTAIDIEGSFDGLAGNQAVVIKSGSSSSSPEPTPTTAPTVQTSYTDDFTGFSSAPDSRWSLTSSDTTPTGSNEFLGQFDNQTASLSLTGLPTHTSVGVEFDLYIIGSWDGNTVVSPDGPDFFDLTILNDPLGPLVLTTFSNNVADNQAWPLDYPGGDFTFQEGSIGQGTLGFTTDSLYHLTFTADHTASDIRLDFSGSGLNASGSTDEFWGLDNVLVTVQ